MVQAQLGSHITSWRTNLGWFGPTSAPFQGPIAGQDRHDGQHRIRLAANLSKSV